MKSWEQNASHVLNAMRYNYAGCKAAQYCMHLDERYYCEKLLFTK